MRTQNFLIKSVCPPQTTNNFGQRKYHGELTWGWGDGCPCPWPRVRGWSGGRRAVGSERGGVWRRGAGAGAVTRPGAAVPRPLDPPDPGSASSSCAACPGPGCGRCPTPTPSARNAGAAAARAMTPGGAQNYTCCTCKTQTWLNLLFNIFFFGSFRRGFKPLDSNKDLADVFFLQFYIATWGFAHKPKLSSEPISFFQPMQMNRSTQFVPCNQFCEHALCMTFLLFHCKFQFLLQLCPQCFRIYLNGEGKFVSFENWQNSSVCSQNAPKVFLVKWNQPKTINALNLERNRTYSILDLEKIVPSLFLIFPT